MGQQAKCAELRKQVRNDTNCKELGLIPAMMTLAVDLIKSRKHSGLDLDSKYRSLIHTATMLYWLQSSGQNGSCNCLHGVWDYFHQVI